MADFLFYLLCIVSFLAVGGFLWALSSLLQD